MKTSIIIPTYKRPLELKKCLISLNNLTLKPNEVIVIYFNEKKTTEILNNFKSEYNIIKIKTNKQSQINSLNLGLEKTKGDIICFIDDDVIVKKDWLKRIKETFEINIKVGGVGGRDNLYINRRLIKGYTKRVGRVSWKGIYGGHHLKSKKQYVDTLKGANMSFRKKALDEIKFDTKLKGNGAEVRNDTNLCLKVKSKGWKLLYDPKIEVDHFPSARYEKNKRGNYNWDAVYAGAYNEFITIWPYFSKLEKLGYILYAFFVGNIFTPGILQTIRLIPREGFNAIKRFFATLYGRNDAILTLINSK